MAFLDNSGDIILDAVLTDAGVAKMASGEFKITKFALGDDEINYSLYDKDNSGGPTYYDLEILQTPVLEAFASQIGSINYGLVTLPQNLLYMNSLKINALSLGLENKSRTNGVFYVADPTNNTTATSISTILEAANISTIGGSAVGNAGYILLEAGIESADVSDTVANVNSYLSQQGLVDNGLNVSYDTRIFGSILGLNNSSKLANDGTNNTLNAQIGMVMGTRTNATSIKNYSSSRVRTLPNQIYTKDTGTDTKSTYSVISGPAATFAVVSPNLKAGLNTSVYTKYGTRNATPDSVGTAISYIDSTIYATGATTGATLQLTMRVARVYVA